MTPRAWIVGAYGENGGNHMNHHIAKICQQKLGLETISIGISSSKYGEQNIFNHDQLFEECTIEEFLEQHHPSDILISNPSFSKYLLGLRSNCKKVMYVQHYNTFRRLDLGFDTFVAVSDIVKNYLSSVYNINAHKISAFTEDSSSTIPFNNKKHKILVYQKLNDHQEEFYDFFIGRIKASLAEKNLEYIGGRMNRDKFLSKIDQYKFLLTLSIDEGFGLVSLEAMQRGSVVFGFDGFGGRDYMIRGYNCLTSKYPHWESICQSINDHIDNDMLCQRISQQAIQTASEFSYEKFSSSWITLLSSLLNNKNTSDS